MRGKARRIHVKAILQGPWAGFAAHQYRQLFMAVFRRKRLAGVGGGATGELSRSSSYTGEARHCHSTDNGGGGGAKNRKKKKKLNRANEQTYIRCTGWYVTCKLCLISNPTRLGTCASPRN